MQTLCRPPVDIKLQKKDGSSFESNTGVSLPIVHVDTVTIYPGETIHVEAGLGKDSLENLRAVEKVADPSKTLTLTFKQEPAGKKSKRPMMKLTVDNPFPKKIKYHTQVMLLSGNIIKTSTCPVGAGQTSYESWPDPIFQLILTDFRFAGEKEEKCEY